MTTRRTNGDFFCKIKKYWWILALVFGIGGWVAMIEISLASSSKKDIRQDEMIAEQHFTQMQQAKLLEKMAGQIDVILILLEIKVDNETIKRWKAMPKYPPVDSFGIPINGAEWLCISEDYLIGRIWKWAGLDSILVKTEWDERPKNSN